MARAKIANDEEIIADYKIGEYTIRKLAEMHNVSRSTVARVVADVSIDNSELIDQKVKTELAIKSKPIAQQNAIDAAVRQKVAFGKQLNSFAKVAMDKATALAAISDNGADLRQTTEAVDKLSVTTKYNDRHPAPASTKIQVGMQQNVTLSQAEKMAKEFLVK